MPHPRVAAGSPETAYRIGAVARGTTAEGLQGGRAGRAPPAELGTAAASQVPEVA